MEVKYKPGVRLTPAHKRPEIARIIEAAKKTAPKFIDNTLWITSANDGKHMKNSKHYTNAAFDIRVWNIVGGSIMGKSWAERMRKELGRKYDVIYEGDHIHAEYDPK